MASLKANGTEVARFEQSLEIPSGKVTVLYSVRSNGKILSKAKFQDGSNTWTPWKIFNLPGVPKAAKWDASKLANVMRHSGRFTEVSCAHT